MNRILRALAFLLCLAATAAQAQLPQTLPANTVVGRLGIGSGAGQAIPFSVLSGKVGIVTGTVSGTASAITLSTGLGLTSYANGQVFGFTPLATATAALPTLAVDGLAAKSIRSVDGYSFSIWYDIQKDKPLILRYSSSLDAFIIQSPPLQWEDAIFGHGRVKLQASSATALSLSQEEGMGLLMWNATTSAYRMVLIPSITVSNLFSGNSTIVNGATGQNLSNNQTYSIYVHNTDPNNQYANTLEFWATNLGSPGAGWNPTLNELGIFVKPTAAGGSTADNTRTFVGTIRTGAGTIENDITPAAAMCNRVYSHFTMGRWRFGYQTTQVSNVASSSSLTTQTTPSVCSVTEGISDSPIFHAKAVATCDTSGTTISFRISISGTAFEGSAYTATSPTYTAGVPYVNAPVPISASWESAPPMGFYTAKTDIAVSAGSCTFATDILGSIAQ